MENEDGKQKEAEISKNIEVQNTDWFYLTMTEHWLIMRQNPKRQNYLNMCLIYYQVLLRIH